MKVPGTSYLVGGAVRDELLGLSITERDWVVVGATIEQMLEAGFRQIGKAYPVFLHPRTHEEYALARLEKKTGPGHGGFSFDFNKEVTLGQDLRRRDLTINAMAKSEDGQLIDLFGGQEDLKTKSLRHVSDAFADDPLRCFRVARFAARMPDFEIHPDTLQLISSMQHELGSLSAERVWNEWVLALNAQEPARFYQAIHDAGIHEPWFSGLKLSELAVRQHQLSLDRPGSFALVGLLHDVSLLEEHFDRLSAPNKVRDLVLNVARFKSDLANIRTLSNTDILSLFKSMNALHKQASFDTFVGALSSVTPIDSDLILSLQHALLSVKIQGSPSPELGSRIEEKRLEVIEKMIES